MDILEEQNGAVTIVRIVGRIDSNTSKLFSDRLIQRFKAGGARLIIDFKNILYISSAGFRALLVAGKMADENRGSLVLCNLTPEVKRLFELGEFVDLFQICGSREEGLALFSD